MQTMEKVVNESGYKIYKVLIGGEVTYFRCSNHCVSSGYDIDEMNYDSQCDTYDLKASCFWVSTIKECEESLLRWADKV